jgi:hypothetical protein
MATLCSRSAIRAADAPAAVDPGSGAAGVSPRLADVIRIDTLISQAN